MSEQGRRITLDELKSRQNKFEDGLVRVRNESAAFTMPRAADTGLLQDCLQQVAMQIDFDPRQLAERFRVSPAVLNSLLNMSVRYFSESDEEKWQLREGVRNEVLQKLKEQSRIADCLKPASIDDSPDQRIFSRWMSGLVATTAGLTRDEVAATLRVYGMLDGVVELPSRDELASHLERLNIVSTLEDLAKGRFAGRTDELSKLRAYVAGDDVATPLLVCGPGGMGKSTLLGEYLLRDVVREGVPACPFAYLDFDRRSLSIEYPVTLLYETLWQLAAFYPANRTAFLALREQWRPQISSNDKFTESSLESIAFSSSRETGKFIHEFCLALADANLAATPLLLILDTFEEVQSRSRDYVGELFGFLEDLRMQLSESALGRSQLRVILSGRVPVPDFPTTEFPLKELDPTSAKSFLEGLGVASSIAPRIVSQVRGVPLTLRLAATLVLNTQDELLSIGDFAAMHPIWYQLQDEQLQGLIYDRYLQQIHDPDVKKLAHPGLVLRRITPEIIRSVLAETCGVKVAGDEIDALSTIRTAEELFEAMAREVSLVSREENGVLRHRPELRRVMLELLQTDKRAKVRKIHKAAVEFYEKVDDISARAEEIYHRLQLGQSARTISQRWMAGIEPLLSDCLDELPSSSRTILATRIGTDAPLEGDLRARQETDQASWERYANRKAARLIKLNNPREALEVLEERHERLPGSPLFEVELSARKHASDWAGMQTVAMQGIASAADAGNRSLAHKLCQSLVHAVLLSGETENALRILERARSMMTEGNSVEELAYHLELDLAEIQVMENVVDGGVILSEQRPPQNVEPSSRATDLYLNAEARLIFLMERSRSARLAGLARRAAGRLHGHRAELVSRVIRKFGVVDSSINKPQQRLLCRACLTWDEIVSANLRRPPGVLANAAGLLTNQQSLENAWTKAIEPKSNRISEIIESLISRYGLPDDATRRFGEFFRLPHETELFAPVHTKLLDALSFDELRKVVETTFAEEFEEITKGTDHRDLIRQLINWAYEEGHFQDLLDAAQLPNAVTPHSSRQMLHFDGAKRKELLLLLMNCFSDPSHLGALLQKTLDVSLETISSASGSFDSVLRDVIDHFTRQDRIDEFLEAVASEYPQVERLRQFTISVGVDLSRVAAPTRGAAELRQQRSAENPATYMDSESWQATRFAFESTICRIEVGERTVGDLACGTGFLVGPDLVLTCRTLFSKMKLDGQLQCRCTFDFRHDDLGRDLEGFTYKLASLPIPEIASSNELDYVLLRLAGQPGLESIGHKGRQLVRGWLSLSDSRDPIAGEGTYLLHHPGGGPLQFSFEEHSILATSRTEIRYQNSTAPGSMGAPLVTTDWRVVGIHRGRNSEAMFCFGLPIQAILSDLRQIGLGKEIEQRFSERVVAEEQNAKDIQQLQHFFWSYIDESADRIRILVDLDLLPHTMGKMVPYTLERLAVDRASSSGKLHSLWDAVMPFVPDAKRKPNPFPVPGKRY